ncbi:MAG: glycosyltransferase family 39 protein, partial [bacterium]
MKTSCVVGILFLLLIFYVVSNTAWVHHGPSLYGRDVVGHMQLVEKFYYRIGDIVHGTDSLPAKAVNILSLLHEDSLPFHGTYMWPKLVHLSATIPCFVFGLRPMVMIQFNLLFFGILITSVYFIGKRCHSSSAGLFAAVLVSLYPAIWGQTRKFGLDFPVTAMTSLAIAVLVYTDHFRRRGRSLLLGAAIGLGILTKGQIVLYLGGPLLIDLCVGLRRGRAHRRARVVNFIFVNLLALLISSPWWWGIALDLWRVYFGVVTDYPFSWAYAYKKQTPFTAGWFLFHLVHVFISMGLLYAFVFVLSLPAYVRSRSGHKIV